MRAVSKLNWVLLVVMMTVTWPALAQIDVDLANKCRTMMIQAHPTVAFGSTGSAAAQRSYFQECVSRRGDMPEASKSGENRAQSTTGKGN
jgi:hypothetical protein